MKAKAAEATAVMDEKDEAGILCPRCRFPLRVYRTKQLTGAIARERICDRCRQKIDTEEKEIE